MKKSVLITIMSIIAIISLVFVFVGCKDKTGTDPSNGKTGVLENTTFFSAAYNVADPNISISIISKDDNVEIYSRSSNGAETNPYNLSINGGSYVDAVENFEYRDDAFSETKISGRTFTGTVKDPKDYLGVTDSDVDIENVEIVIGLKKSGGDYTLDSVEVTFDLTIESLGYKATITITP